jgi:hypothetical protein
MVLKTVAIFVVLVLTSIPVNAEELIKLGLDDTSRVSPKIEADTKVKVEGKSSVKITTKWPTTVCLGEVVKPNIENAQLIYSAKVKSDLSGSAYLEMWAHVKGRQYFSRGMNEMVTGKSDWRTIHTPFIFQKDQKPEKITLNLVINGMGTVWVDEIILSKDLLPKDQLNLE